MSLGFEQAGFDVCAAVEVDPIHCAIHKFNFPSCTVIPRSVRNLSGNEIRLAAGIGKTPVDVVFGGPPCQGFSLIGQRSLDDPRNHLVQDFVRIAAELNARTFVFENVKGLTQGKHRTFLNEIIDSFSRAGYNVRADWRVLDAADYGVPQYRERLILLGAKNGQEIPEYPSRQSVPFDESHSANGFDIGPNCEEALGDLPDADCFETLNKQDEVKAVFGRPSVYVEELRCISNGAWHFGHMRNWNPRLLTSSARTEHTEISRNRFAVTSPGSVEPISRFFKLSADGLSNTLRAGTDGARGAFTSPRPIHYKYPRCVTVREMARLHGFPDWFRFHTTKWHGARQIGNSVPPPLARVVAAQVLKALGRHPHASTLEMKLGDPALLSIAMTEASALFEVEKPCTRRDRTSGARKRSQMETEAARLEAQEETSG